MDSGAWLRLQCAGMMGITRVVHAVVVSAMVRDFGASERPYSALAAYGLLRWLHAGLEAVGQQAVCATNEADWHGSRLGRCVLSTMRTELCRNLDGVAVLRSGVASKMALYGLPRTVGSRKWTCCHVYRMCV